MLFRSTGLGKTELKAKVNGVVRQGDYLILQVETLESVKRKIRAGISLKDMWAVIRSVAQQLCKACDRVACPGSIP